MFQPEPIPDEDLLFYRINKIDFDYDTSEIKPVAFQPKGDAMSTEWSKYSSAIDCKLRSAKPDNQGVVSMITGEIRSIKPLKVEHSPTKFRAHSHVLNAPKGNDPFKEEIRILIRRACKWEIDVPKKNKDR